MKQNNLYYKRGMYILDKMLKTFSNDSTFYSKRFDFLITELKRSKINYQLVHKDINSFNISAIVALLGINKENIEILDKHNNYENLYFTKEQKDYMYLDVYYKLFPEFLNDRNINTIFDDWLSVEKCDHPTLSYMMNIRNGLLHSEYEPLDEFGCLCSIDNSNYTHFKSKVITSGITNFCIFYFGNNSWTGLSENFEIYKTHDHTTPIKDVEGLRKILTEELEVNYITYQSDSKTTNNKSPERKVYNVIESHRKNYRGELEDLLNKQLGPNTYTIESKHLSKEECDLVIEMIKHYYGEEFYNLDSDSQRRQFVTIHKYLKNSRSIISEWICDYLFLLDGVKSIYQSGREDEIRKYLEGFKQEYNNRSVFACRTSLLIIKLYHILYRLQNKKYEEVDYNKINFDTIACDYNYERTDIDGSITTDFNLDKLKLRPKNPTLSDKELEIKAICEIIRNALSHGNIEMTFKLDNNTIIENIVFTDIYHSKTRKLEMSLDKLEILLNSEAFTPKECIIKEEKDHTLSK